MRKVGVVLSLVFAFTLLLGFVDVSTKGISMGTSVAYGAPNLKDSLNKVENSSGVLGSSTKDKIAGLGKDGMDIVGIVVMVVVTITGIFTAVKFTRAGEDATERRKLKGILIAHIGAFLFLANYFGLISFVFDRMSGIF